MKDRKKNVEAIMECFQLFRRAMLKEIPRASANVAITPAQWPVIALLRQNKAMGIKEIAAELRISSSAATQLVDGLVQHGFAHRETGAVDRRTMSVKLSDKAAKNFAAMRRKSLIALTRMYSVLSDTELRQYAKLHQKIAVHLKKNER